MSAGVFLCLWHAPIAAAILLEHCPQYDRAGDYENNEDVQHSHELAHQLDGHFVTHRCVKKLAHQRDMFGILQPFGKFAHHVWVQRMRPPYLIFCFRVSAPVG